MAKKRKGTEYTVGGLHLVLDLQLEEAIEHVCAMSRLRDDLRVKVRPVDNDTAEIDLQQYEQRKIIARVQIALRRWRGTQTRLDARPGRYRSIIMEYILRGIVTFVFFFGPPFGQSLSDFSGLVPLSWVIDTRRLMRDLEAHVADITFETLPFGVGLRTGNLEIET